MASELLVLNYATPNRRRRLPRFLRWPPISRLVLEALIGMVIGLALKGNNPDGWDLGQIWIIFILVWTPATILILCRYLVPRMKAHADALHKERRRWRFALLLSSGLFIWSIRYDECPHAKYFAAGPIYWTIGNPCSNPRQFKSIFGLVFED